MKASHSSLDRAARAGRAAESVPCTGAVSERGTTALAVGLCDGEEGTVARASVGWAGVLLTYLLRRALLVPGAASQRRLTLLGEIEPSYSGIQLPDPAVQQHNESKRDDWDRKVERYD